MRTNDDEQTTPKAVNLENGVARTAKATAGEMQSRGTQSGEVAFSRKASHLHEFA